MPVLKRFLIIIISIFCSWSVGLAQSLHITFDSLIGREGIGIGDLMRPSDVAVDPASNIYVLDTGNNRIQQFDLNGQYIRHIGGFGFETQQFNQPTGIYATGLDVFVADTQNRRIQRFDRRLNYLGVISGDLDIQGNEDLAFGFPSAIAVSGIGDIFILDIENEEIIKMNTSGRIETRFGGFNYGEGRLRKPSGIAVNPMGIIYVADTGNHRIAVFDSFGGYLRSIGTDYLNAPEDIALDDKGRIYVVNSGNDQLVVFVPNGDFLLNFGTSGNGLSSFTEPQGITIGQNGMIYIADTGNHRIQRFTIQE